MKKTPASILICRGKAILFCLVIVGMVTVLLPVAYAQNAEDFEHYQAQSPQELLKGLARHYERGRGQGRSMQPACVAVTLTSGVVQEGCIVRVSTERGKEVLMLKSKGASGGDLTVVSLYRVSSVRVFNAADYASVLSGGTVPDRSYEKAPSRLQLKRQAAALTKGITPALSVEITWDTIPKTDNAHRALDSYLDYAGRAMKESVRDEMGKKAWKGLKGIRIEHADLEYLRIKKQGSWLLLQVNCTAAVPLNAQRQITDKLFKLL